MQINLHLNLNHAQLPRWQFACEQRSVLDGNRCSVTLIANVNVRQMMLFLDLKKHQNDDTVEHTDGWHGELLLKMILQL